MVSRRTRARLELAVAVATLGFSLWLRRVLRRHDEGDELRDYALSGLAAGTLSQVVHLSLYDRDAWRIRTRRRRGFLLGLCEIGVERALRRRSADPAAFGDGFWLGRGVGTVCYRCWYGLLRPLPGDD
ncbi:hypothetical protein SAMN04487947_0057 [Halogeometricum rufum]|uniref:DUF8097 domain-containing protein n=1 Tax=Halogeometricum rufum TaxID=553469 RepID=A0A1I6FV05_9EURY|nr:hypothetical protein [Halogeometricum rufum]SFR33769.1 hypothetical protein SAMN04487947_0057 [Halogeometricum rufum]